MQITETADRIIDTTETVLVLAAAVICNVASVHLNNKLLYFSSVGLKVKLQVDS